jgi:serine/threonine-protein kinase
MEKRPEVLEQDAREILESLGHELNVVDRAFGFIPNYPYLRHISNTDPSPDRWKRLASNRPAPVAFWYRQSPRYLAPQQWFHELVRPRDPELYYSGEALVIVDPDGRLAWLEIIPPELEEVEDPAPKPDWETLFKTAGLDISKFVPVRSAWVPPVHCDTRAAWEGHDPDEPATPLRIEAGAHRGKPIFFRLVESYDRPTRMEGFASFEAQRVWIAFMVVFLVIFTAGAVLLARRNLRLGRGDRRGATRLAATIGILAIVEWILLAHHVPDPFRELVMFTMALGFSSLLSVFTWLAYVAVEPYLRRRWPDTLVSWNRLLMGRFRDPLVGRDLLFGIAAFWATNVLVTLRILAARWLACAPEIPFWPGSIETLLGGRYVVGVMIGCLFGAVTFAAGVLLVVSLLSVILRKQWLVFAAFLLFMVGNLTMQVDTPALYVRLVGLLVGWTILFFVLSRFGLLSFLTIFVAQQLWNNASLSPDWYRMTALVFSLAILGIAAYGFFTSLGVRPLIRDGALPSD